MNDIDKLTMGHPSEIELADLLASALPRAQAAKIMEHVARCDECLTAYVSAHEAAGTFGGSGRRMGLIKKLAGLLRKINPCLMLAAASFMASFMVPRYFIQLLVATLVLGIKWVADSKSTKMLVMIYDAWRRGGDKEASKVLERLGNRL